MCVCVRACGLDDRRGPGDSLDEKKKRIRYIFKHTLHQYVTLFFLASVRACGLDDRRGSGDSFEEIHTFFFDGIHFFRVHACVAR